MPPVNGQECPVGQHSTLPVEVILPTTPEIEGQPSFGEPIITMIGVGGSQETSDAYFQERNFFCLFDGPGAGGIKMTGKDSLKLARNLVKECQAGRLNINAVVGTCIVGHLEASGVRFTANDGRVVGIYIDDEGQVTRHTAYALIETSNLEKVLVAGSGNDRQVDILSKDQLSKSSAEREFFMPMQCTSGQLSFIEVETDGSIGLSFDGGSVDLEAQTTSPDEIVRQQDTRHSLLSRIDSVFVAGQAPNVAINILSNNYQQNSLSTVDRFSAAENKDIVTDDCLDVIIPINSH